MNLISVIVPVYNVKAYLEQCVISIAEQKFSDFEIILVDDGSTDGSSELCDELKVRYYPLINVVHKRNGGLGSARNAGVNLANGQYLIFIDSDDWLAEGALEKLYKISAKDNLDIIFFAAQNVYEDATAQEQMASISYDRKSFLNEVMPGEDYVKKVLPIGEYMSSVCLRMYSMKFYKKNRLEFCENIIHEDEDVAFLSCLCAARVEVIPDKYYMRRFRSGSIMTSKTYLRSAEGYRYAWEKIWEYMRTASESQRPLCVNYTSMFTDICISYYLRAKGNEKRTLYKMIKEMCSRQKGAIESKRYRLVAISPFSYYVYNKIREKKHIIDENRRLSKLESGHFRNWVNCKFDSSEKIFLIGTPIHGNVGDHLIAKSERDFFAKKFPNTKLIEVSLYYCRRFYERIKRRINERDTICITGGGWLGDCWVSNELFVQRVIKDFPQNRVIILPQTIFYSEDSKMIGNAAKIYSSHNKLLVCVRDKQSEDVALNKLGLKKEQVIRMPDFALLYHSVIRHQRDNCVGVCLRNDRELSMAQTERETWLDYISKSKYTKVNINTNDETRVVAIKDRDKYIDEIMKKIAKCDVMITDRLHAMIMCALVGTPCLAFDNATHKVAGVYEAWLSKLPFIRMAPKDDNCYSVIKSLQECEDMRMNLYVEFSDYENNLAEMMKKLGE